jgi:CBS domain-containing protein
MRIVSELYNATQTQHLPKCNPLDSLENAFSDVTHRNQNTRKSPESCQEAALFESEFTQAPATGGKQKSRSITMKSNLAYQHDVMVEAQTIGQLVSIQPCLCIAEDCPVDTIMAMMSNMGTHVAAVVGKGNVFEGFVNRSSLLGHVTIKADFDVAKDLDLSPATRLKAGDVMIGLHSFLPSDLDISEAIRIMEEHGYKAIPVLGDNAQFVGIAEISTLRTLEKGDLAQGLMSFLARYSNNHNLATHH